MVLFSRDLRWWRRHGGVRLTTALAAAAVVGVALAVAAVLLVVLLQRNLTRAVEASALQRARDVAAALSHGGVGEIGPLDGSRDRSVVQVLRAGAVLASSREIAGQGPVTVMRPDPGQVRTGQARLPGGEDDDHLLVALGVAGPGGEHLVVVVAQSLDPVETSLKALRPLLLAGIPVLVLVVGTAAFVLVGRTLRPVEDIRRKVAAIDSNQLGSRVPVPPARDEVARLADTMNDMLERLDTAATAQRRFVSDASHELRSPLATVRTSMEVAQLHPEVTDWATVTQVVLDETSRLQALVADMLLLARTDEGRLQLHREEVDLDDLAEQEAARLRRTGLTVHTRILPTRVIGDPHRLARVLRNLTDNAARHARTAVRIEVEAQGPEAVVTVADDGPGIAADQRDRVFERFVRLDESRTRASGGTGLGLPIVMQLVQAHGGRVTIEDAPGGGALLRVRLPCPAGEGS